jgi:Tfp pilus assembly protein PilO
VTARLRRPAAVGVLVAFVLTVGWWQALWQPQGASIAAAHKQVQLESTNLVTVEQSVAHLKHLQTISAKLAALEKLLSTAAPATDELDQVLLSLNALAQSTGLTLRSITPSRPAASTSGLATMSVQLQGQADYFGVQSFLDALRASTRLIVVDTITEAPAGSKSSNLVSVSLGIHLFAGLAAPTPAAALAAAAPTPTTAAPTGIISGPVTKAKNAVNSLNARQSQVSTQANSVGGP